MRVLAIVLSGGSEPRLSPLAGRNAPSFLAFGGAYRLIDVTLSNCVNSKICQTWVLTPSDTVNLHQHLRSAWSGLPQQSGACVEILSPALRGHSGRYMGTADAVYRNLDRLQETGADLVLLLRANHIYKMDYRELIDWHMAQGADVTLATTLVTPREAQRFGIVKRDSENNVVGFEEQPRHKNPARSVSDRRRCDASMGVYVFSREVLFKALAEDARDPCSAHDFGRDLLPRVVEQARVTAFNFAEQPAPYWRDVETVDAYYHANMDLISPSPSFDIHDHGWPVRSAPGSGAPARFGFDERYKRRGMALDSLVSNGCVVSGGRVCRSVLGAAVRVESQSDVDSAVLLSGVRIGRKCRIYRAVIDQGVDIPDGTDIGVDLNRDRRAGHYVSAGGIVVLTARSEKTEVAVQRRTATEDTPGVAVTRAARTS